MASIIESIKKGFYTMIVALWIIGNLVWGIIVHTLAAITPWDLPEIEKALRPWGFETNFEVAERNDLYLNPISYFTYTPERYPEVARKLEGQELRELEEAYAPLHEIGVPVSSPWKP